MEERQREASERLKRREALEAALPLTEAELQAAERRLTQSQETLTALESQQAAQRAQAEALRAQLPCESLAEAQTQQQALSQERDTLLASLETARQEREGCRLALAQTEAAVERLTAVLRAAGPVDRTAAEAEREALLTQQRALQERQQAIAARLSANQTALTRMRERWAELRTLEERWTWLRALSNTVNGALAGREKIALETYVQTACFDRILRRANLRFLAMSDGQYELKRQREAENNRSLGLGPLRRDPVRRRRRPLGHHVCGRGVWLLGRGDPAKGRGGPQRSGPGGAAGGNYLPRVGAEGAHRPAGCGQKGQDWREQGGGCCLS